MVPLIVIGVLLFALWANRGSVTDVGPRQGGGGSVPPPPSGGTTGTTGVTGGVSIPPGGLSIGALGAAAGGALGDFWANTVHGHEAVPGLTQTTHAAAVPVTTLIGGAAATALFSSGAAVGGVIGGLTTIGIWAFPIAVGVFAALEIARNIEDVVRLAEWDKRWKVIQALVSRKQFKAAFDLANKNASEGYTGMGNFQNSGDGVAIAESSDFPNVLLADENGRVVQQTPVRQYRDTLYASVKEFWDSEKAPILAAIDNANTAQATANAAPTVAAQQAAIAQVNTAWGLASHQVEQFFARHQGDWDSADNAANGIIVNMPWFSPWVFNWRPPEVKAVNTAMGKIALTGSSTGGATNAQGVVSQVSSTGAALNTSNAINTNQQNLITASNPNVQLITGGQGAGSINTGSGGSTTQGLGSALGANHGRWGG